MAVGSVTTTTGFIVSVAVLVAGVVLGAWNLRRVLRRATDPSARAILDERLARGSVSIEDYARRRAVLTERSPSLDGRRGPRVGVTIAAALVMAGLAGSAAFAATGTRGGWGPMMGRWMMGGKRGSIGQAAAPVPGARTITVSGDEYSFRPKVVRARPDETLNLRFENRGDLFHTMTISALDFELRAGGSENVTGSLRAPASGNFSIVCVVPGHTEAGMRARLVTSAS